MIFLELILESFKIYTPVRQHGLPGGNPWMKRRFLAGNIIKFIPTISPSFLKLKPLRMMLGLSKTVGIHHPQLYYLYGRCSPFKHVDTYSTNMSGLWHCSTNINPSAYILYIYIYLCIYVYNHNIYRPLWYILSLY